MRTETDSRLDDEDASVDTSTIVNVVARRNALGGISYKTEEIAPTEREAISIAAFSTSPVPVDNRQFPVVGVYTVKMTIIGFRRLVDSEKHIMRGA